MSSTRLDGKAAAVAIREGSIAIDVRSPRTRAENGVIEGAIVLSKQELIAAVKNNMIGRLRADQKIVLFCASEQGTFKAVRELQENGVEGVYDVAGGFAALKANGMPTRDVAPETTVAPTTP